VVCESRLDLAVDFLDTVTIEKLNPEVEIV